MESEQNVSARVDKGRGARFASTKGNLEELNTSGQRAVGPGFQRFRPSSGPRGPHPPRGAGRAPGSPAGPAPKSTESCTRRPLAGTTRRCGEPGAAAASAFVYRPAGSWSRSTPGIVPAGRPPGPVFCSPIGRAPAPAPSRPGPRHLPCGARMH